MKKLFGLNAVTILAVLAILIALNMDNAKLSWLLWPTLSFLAIALFVVFKK